jgi:adenosylhomocysteine nucleosidase
MANAESNAGRDQCSLLVFLATSTEEEALHEAARSHGLSFEKVRNYSLGEYHWLGTIGNESLIAVRPARELGIAVMGALGRLGSAARAIHFRVATGAQGIVQIGMAFGIDPARQRHGDVLVSSSLIPYDNRDVEGRERTWLDRILMRPATYMVDYSRACRQPARSALVNLFLREQARGNHPFGIHAGALLSGAARIRSSRFRDELLLGVPGGDDPIVGGEMEGVGLLAASTSREDPIWCVVKGISDFADENSNNDVEQNRDVACRNAAEFVLNALVNDAASA